MRKTQLAGFYRQLVRFQPSYRKDHSKMMKHKRAVPLLLILVYAVLTLSLQAQSPDGALVGTVSDATNARVAGASVKLSAKGLSGTRFATTNSVGEFRIESLPPGAYMITVEARGFATKTGSVDVAVSSTPTIHVKLQPASVHQEVQVEGTGASLTNAPIETSSSVVKTSIGRQDLEDIPLASRSFANIAYLAPMTEPVEPSDPTKARITAVSFGGSSGLNVDLSVDGGDNNDDFIGGFLQNYSPDSMQEFTVRTAQFYADTSRTNGGSVIISSRRGTNDWHGDASFLYRNQKLNARNPLDNPDPNPKQPFSRGNYVFDAGGPLVKDKLWFFSSMEVVNENASVAYSNQSLGEFNALAQLASSGQIPGVPSIAVPTSVNSPFHDTIFSTALTTNSLTVPSGFCAGRLISTKQTMIWCTKARCHPRVLPPRHTITACCSATRCNLRQPGLATSCFKPAASIT